MIGTAYGNWLGTCYVSELARRGRPRTYALVDHRMYSGSAEWEPGGVLRLRESDPQVAAAFVSSEFRWGFPERADILDADTDEIYEIKPVRSRENGVAQLADYLGALRRFASTTEMSPLWKPWRQRNWRGGRWDPSRYPLVVPGVGKIYILHAWQDDKVPGLILYDIASCERPAEPLPAELGLTRVTEVSKPLAELQPGLQAMVRQVLPYGTAGESWAILTSTRFVELFVKPAWDRDQDRIYDRYGPRPGPAFKTFMVDSMVLANILTGATPLIIEETVSVFASNEQLRQALLYVAVGTAVVGVVLLLVALPELLAAAAVAAELGTAAGVTAEVAAEMTAGATLAEGAGTVALSEAPTAAPLLINAVGPLIQLGRGAAGYGLGAAASAGSTGVTGAQIAGGIGLMGAMLIGVLPANADALPAGSPQQRAELAHTELPMLVPAELLVPVDGRVRADSFAFLGGEKFFIAGMVQADGG